MLPPRPTLLHPEVRLGAAELLLKPFAIFAPSKPQNELEQDIAESYLNGLDGFKIGFNLAKRGWDITEDFIKIARDNRKLFVPIWKSVTRKWVEENNLKPTFAIGTKLVLQESGIKKIGTIESYDANTHQYYVAYPRQKEFKLYDVAGTSVDAERDDLIVYQGD